MALDGRSPRVLVVEDDAEIAQAVQRSLRLEGYEVRIAPDGEKALADARSYVPDLVLLDLGLPGVDGIDVARQMRADGDVPILMLTARDAVESRVEGLDSGADDYLVKPFDRQELLARIRALLRRRPPRGAASLVVADLELNPDTHEVLRGDRSVELTQREFELLEYLMRNERIVISRQRLLDEVWGYDPFSTTNTIEVFVSNVRRKLEAGGEPRLLHTIRGAGDVLRACPHARPLAPCPHLVGADLRDPVRVRRRRRAAHRRADPLGLQQRARRRRRRTQRPPLHHRRGGPAGRPLYITGVVGGQPPSYTVAGPRLDDYAAPNNAAIRILDRSGRLRARTKGAPDFPVNLGRSTQIGGYRVETRNRAIEVRAPDGRATHLAIPLYVQYARPVSEIEHTVDRVRLFLVVGVLGGTLLALVAGLLAARRAMQPIAALTSSARLIARTRDPTDRVPVPPGEDEIVELARTLDDMLASLDAAQGEREAMLERQRQFVADASHELRTPLT